MGRDGRGEKEKELDGKERKEMGWEGKGWEGKERDGKERKGMGRKGMGRKWKVMGQVEEENKREPQERGM